MRKFDLKPCPFCGDPNPQVVWDSGDEDKLGVKCFACGGCIDTEKDTAEEAVEAWNRRVGDESNPNAVDLSSVYSTAYKSGYEKGTADRPRGEWIYHEDYHTCSVCGADWLFTDGTDGSDFCPNCGADMRKESNDDEKRSD